MRCFKCGATEDRAVLYDFVSNKGISQICRKCKIDEPHLHMIKKPNDSKFREVNPSPTVYERLSIAAGINPYKKKEEKSKELTEQEKKILELAEQNFQKEIEAKPMPSENLIQNFHWGVMRARRREKLTQQELAEKLKVPGMAVKMLEQGKVKESDFHFIRKVENYLNIIILDRDKIKIPVSTVIDSNLGGEKKEVFNINMPEMVKKVQKGNVVDISDLKEGGFTISDLKGMKEEKEQKVLREIKGKDVGDYFEEGLEEDRKKMISDEFENL